MRPQLTIFFLLIPIFLTAQQLQTAQKNSFIFTPEVMAGQSAESNSNYPDRTLQVQLWANFGWDHSNNRQEWAQRLKSVRTGLGLGYTSFGNSDSLGSAITLMPNIEFNAFRSERLKVNVGMGGSYFTEKYDPVTNPNNQGITTDLAWSFRLFMYYEFLQKRKLDWRIGLGYSHHSNGHTRLPNQGVNSFLVSLSADIKNLSTSNSEAVIPKSYNRSMHSYITVRSGYGLQVLSSVYNDKKGVYTIAGEYGKVLNNTFRIGIGGYYRFYQQYYDYIKENQSLVQDGREFDHFKENPGWNASNLGIYVKGEFLLNHFGIDVAIGYNLHKPAYRIDWRINQGWDNTPREIPEYWMLGEFNSKFKLKHAISTRMGLKYYLIGTTTAPKHNLYAGFHINANLGQADFTELSLGYVYSFGFKDR
jgi:hypothetical protein